ncbi:similar to Naumovozyma castellii NCAS_0H01340 hypothetical protein [Maudiozyma saulgeensis]|uniref:Uncharacterized protein n=1 Tax=Maudiozyma saulgeensis TaxID=1789683 RepID=A0A1X7RA67_9SACH|nr:similar to Naumovozyma castellii NCAS_0H01340 hypothetical protein [Kazachstania saulgeensis]
MNYPTTKQNFIHRLTRCLVDSLAKPLSELIDILLESMIYTNHTRHHALINFLLNIRETMETWGSQRKKVLNTYALIVKFLETIDQLNNNMLQSLELTIKQCFHFFKNFFDSYQMFHNLINHMDNEKNLNETKFVSSIKSFISFNKQWYIDLMIRSSGYKEFLLTKIKIFSNNINGIDHRNSIIESDLFKKFLLKRKQRLLAESLINKYRSCII